jgi:hypothetical protein
MNKNLLRLILGIAVAVIVGELFFYLVSTGLVGTEFSDKYMTIIWLATAFSFFLAGFLAAFIAKQREILVSFIAFFILNLVNTYYEIQSVEEVGFNFALIIIYIGLPFLLRMCISLLGGFLAKKLNQLQKKEAEGS